MLHHRPRVSPSFPRLAPLLACIAALATLAAPAMAEDLPVLPKGTWELKRTIDGGGGKPQTIAVTKCMSPSEDWKKQNEMLTKMGCRISPVTRSGKSYTFTATCKLQGMVSESKSVITVESDSAYTIQVDSKQNGASSKERLVAKRTGGC